MLIIIKTKTDEYQGYLTLAASIHMRKECVWSCPSWTYLDSEPFSTLPTSTSPTTSCSWHYIVDHCSYCFDYLALIHGCIAFAISHLLLVLIVYLCWFNFDSVFFAVITQVNGKFTSDQSLIYNVICCLIQSIFISYEENISLYFCINF